MELIFTGRSALHYWRTPPRYLIQFPEFQEPINHSQKTLLLKSEAVKLITGKPVDLLCRYPNSQHKAENFNRTVITVELPSGSIRECDALGLVTSPELTLLMLANEMTPAKLSQIIYEFVGYYTIFSPNDDFKRVFKLHDELANYSTRDAWKQSIGTKGQKTNLWIRDPLTTIEKLQTFATQTQGVHGSPVFRKALRMVAGVTRSPFEAKLATLLFAPRSLGGEGLPIETNKIMRFTKTAKNLSLCQYAEADIYISSLDGENCVDIECQGQDYHSGCFAEARDAERTIAVESMGIEIMPVTYRQISNSRAYEELLAQLYSKLKIKRRPKNSRQQEAEQELRACLFSH